MRGLGYAVLCAALLSTGSSFARASHSSVHHSNGHSGSHGHVSTNSSHHSSRYAAGVQRDSHGRIKRSRAAIYAFKKSHPCPATGKTTGACPGYVIDHVQPLKRGGADAPYNMQWQTIEDAKAKDRTE